MSLGKAKEANKHAAGVPRNRRGVHSCPLVRRFRHRSCLRIRFTPLPPNTPERNDCMLFCPQYSKYMIQAWRVPQHSHIYVNNSLGVTARGPGSGSTLAENNADCETLKNDPRAAVIHGNYLDQQTAAEQRPRSSTATGKLIPSAFHGSNKQKSD